MISIIEVWGHAGQDIKRTPLPAPLRPSFIAPALIAFGLLANDVKGGAHCT